MYMSVYACMCMYPQSSGEKIVKYEMSYCMYVACMLHVLYAFNLKRASSWLGRWPLGRCGPAHTGTGTVAATPLSKNVCYLQPVDQWLTRSHGRRVNQILKMRVVTNTGVVRVMERPDTCFPRGTCNRDGRPAPCSTSSESTRGPWSGQLTTLRWRGRRFEKNKILRFELETWNMCCTDSSTTAPQTVSRTASMVPC
jgi:hypothetical protein